MIEPAYVNLHKSMRDILAPLLTDSYKLSHLEMSSNGINKIYSNFTPRFVTYFEKQFPNYDGKIVWFGLQAVIKQVLFEMWEDTFFNKDKTEVIQELKDILGPYIGMTNFKHFEDLYDLGYMPIEIKALKEGSLVSPGIPCFTIINTLNGFQWLPNFLESILTVQLWKMMTTASVGRLFKINSEKYALLTNGSVVGVEFQNHDFSLRGQAGFESAGAAGAGFLLSSSGTDNVPALMFIDNYYNTDIRSNPQAFSVRASEHSITVLGIQMKAKMLESDPDHPVLKLYDEILLAAEHLYLEELLIKFPEGILSYVSDSYDFYSVISKVLPNLKDLIMNRKGKLTVRPDCYSSDTSIMTDSGWKLFKDLSTEDLVAQVLEDGSHEFIKPSKIVNEFYKGPMYHFKDFHGKIDQLVTPNHRMIYKQINPTSKEPVEKIVYASNMKSNGNHYNYFESSSKSQNLNESLNFIEKLNIAFQADGSYTSTKSLNRIRFSFSKQRKIEYMQKLLESNNITYDKYALKDGRFEFNIHIDSTLFFKDFSWVDTSKLCSNWCSEFLEELKLWDSTIRNSGRFCYCTTNKSCADTVELIALSAGKGVFTREDADSRSELFSNCFLVTVLESNKLGGQSWNKTEVEYEGTIHCVTVPSGKLLVKRNRSTMICGNSGDPVEVVAGIEILDYSEEESLDNASYKAFQNVLEQIEVYHACPVNVNFKYKGQLYHTVYVLDVDEFNVLQNWTYSSTKETALTVEEKGTVETLYDIFGGTTNSLGYKLLDEHIGIIYGDGITIQRSTEIFERLMHKKFSSINCVFGVGAFSLNLLSRDSLGIAFKATAAEVDLNDDNSPILLPIYKDPKTDTSKKSAKGLLKVTYDSDTKLYHLEDNVSIEEEKEGLLETVYIDGKLIREDTFEDIKNRMYS